MNLNRPLPLSTSLTRVAIVEPDDRRARALAHAASLVLTPAPVVFVRSALDDLQPEDHPDLVILSGLEEGDRSLLTRLSREAAVLVLADATDGPAQRCMEAGAQDVLPFASIETDEFGRAVRHGLVRNARERELRRAALLDELTGLYNRRGFLVVAQERLAAVLRRKAPAVLAFVDLDGLKRINDTSGHEGGDRALSAVAEAMRKSFRGSDVLGRVGGDEFVAFAEEAGPSDTLLMEARLRHRLAHGREGGLEVSVGWAALDPEHPASLQELLGKADRRMYAARRRSRFRVV